MSISSSPFGLRPAKHPTGFMRAERYIVNVDGNGNLVTRAPSPAQVSIGSILQYGPVYLDANGVPQACGASPTTNPGSPTSVPCVGSFQGVEWSDYDGRRRVSNQWSNPSLLKNSEVWFWLYTDPNITYEIQSVGATLPSTSVGSTYGFSAESGNTVVGFSNVALNVNSTGFANATLPLQVLNVAYDPNLNLTYQTGQGGGGINNWSTQGGDIVTNVYVKLANPQFQAATPAF